MNSGNINTEFIGAMLDCIRQESPLIHNISNLVAMDIIANSLLAVGASPIMAHAPQEVEEMISLAKALVLNIGTLDNSWVENMHVAEAAAKRRNLPVVLDPVGAGASAFRTQSAKDLMAAGPPTVIRGNASEIAALAGADGKTKGVDSLVSTGEVLDAALSLGATSRSVIVVSGETDYVLGSDRRFKIANGNKVMTKVTGMGCTASAMCGACLAVWHNAVEAAAAAMVLMGVAGEIAYAKAGQASGSFRVAFIDALANLDSQTLIAMAKIDEL